MQNTDVAQNFYYYEEDVTDFEKACIENTLEDVKFFLAEKTLLTLENKQDIGFFRGFFRALEKNHQEISKLILEHLNINDLAKININGGDPLLSEFHYDYLKKICKLQHYSFKFYTKADGANVALVMSAALSSKEIFNKLLQKSKFKELLPKSEIVAFLNATLEHDGSIKNDINTDIVYELLDSPKVYKYAAKREYDFGELLSEYNAHKQERLDDITPLPEISKGWSYSPFTYSDCKSPTPTLFDHKLYPSGSERNTIVPDFKPISRSESLTSIPENIADEKDYVFI